jgi:N-acetyl-anhydromuramyl-L-alanine amidase AmpD
METETEERIDDDLKIEKYNSPNHGSRGGIVPDMIVVHTSEGYYKSGIEWLCSTRAQASTHYFVGKEGQVAQLVSLKRAAWGNATTCKSATDPRYYGRSKNALVKARPYSANRYTISIECEGFYSKDGGKLTEKQHKKLSKLIAKIIRRVKKIYGVDIPVDRQHIVSHSELVPFWKPNCGAGIDKERLVKDVQNLLQ